MAFFKNYYSILELPPFSDEKAIKGAFRRLARLYHPDLNAGNAQAEEKFKALNEAYEILGNSQKRAMHDAALNALQLKQARAKEKKEPPQASSQAVKDVTPPSEQQKTPKPPSDTMNDLLGVFLKKGFSANKASPQDRATTATSSKGGIREKIFTQQKEVTGREPSSASETVKSGELRRRGEDILLKTLVSIIEATEGVVKTIQTEYQEPCRRCSSTGKVNGLLCNVCQGEKNSRQTKKIDVHIPAGVKHGSRVRVAREGGKGMGGEENGDLFLQIEIETEPLPSDAFRIEGLHVYTDIRLWPSDLVLGAEITIKTLQGSMLLKVPPGSQPGKVMRLKGQGREEKGQMGDHFVTLAVQLPESVTGREKELYEELRRLRK